MHHYASEMLYGSRYIWENFKFVTYGKLAKLVFKLFSEFLFNVQFDEFVIKFSTVTFFADFYLEQFFVEIVEKEIENNFQFLFVEIEKL